MVRDGEYDDALALLFECIAATEAEYSVTGYGNPGTFYTEKAAIVLRRFKRFDDEVAVLERYVGFLGAEKTAPELLTRLDRARTIRDLTVGD
jgi:hypothetical protein